MRFIASLFAGACLLLVSSIGFAQTDQAVYTDSLVNGWDNWSWATVNFANHSPVRSGNSISVTSGVHQAIYLHHGAFDTSGYANLVFWIHGGTAGGQQLRIQALRSGTAQAEVALPAPVAGTWQQITLPLSQLGVGNVPDMDGFWIQDRAGTGQPTYYLDDIAITAIPVPSAVNVTINAGSVLRTLDNRHFGINTAVWDGVLPDTVSINLMKEAGIKALRFPGGSMSDDYDWQTGKTGSTTWATTFDEFASVAAAINAPAVFITANYGSSTPCHAAAWVQYANITKGYGFKYWEVGNENYGTWENDLNTRPHDPVTYATRFKDYFNQMKAVDPTIKVGAVVTTGEDAFANYADEIVTNPRTGLTHSGWTPVMLTTLKNLGITPDFVVYHFYPQNPGGESDTLLLQSTGNWANDAADLRQQLSDYLGAAGANVELTVTENNSVSSNPGKQSTSLVTGLYMADSFARLAQTEFKSLVWWDFRNGQGTGGNNSASLYGWRNYGDYGIVTAANPATMADRYPTFFAMKALKYLASPGDQIVSCTSDYVGLAAHAIKKSDGKVNVLLINKHQSANLPVNVTVSGGTLPSTAYVYSYGKPQDSAATDLAQSTMAISGSSFSYTTGSYSLTVITVTAPAADRSGRPQRPDRLVDLQEPDQPGLDRQLQQRDRLQGRPRHQLRLHGEPGDDDRRKQRDELPGHRPDTRTRTTTSACGRPMRLATRPTPTPPAPGPRRSSCTPKVF